MTPHTPSFPSVVIRINNRHSIAFYSLGLSPPWDGALVGAYNIYILSDIILLRGTRCVCAHTYIIWLWAQAARQPRFIGSTRGIDRDNEIIYSMRCIDVCFSIARIRWTLSEPMSLHILALNSLYFELGNRKKGDEVTANDVKGRELIRKKEVKPTRLGSICFFKLMILHALRFYIVRHESRMGCRPGVRLLSKLLVINC